jgi:hypothetical protein
LGLNSIGEFKSTLSGTELPNSPSNSLARGRLPKNQTTDLGRPDASFSSPGARTGGGTGGRTGISLRGCGGVKSRLLRSSSGGVGLLFRRGGEKPRCRLGGGSLAGGNGNLSCSRNRDDSSFRGDLSGDSSGRALLTINGAGAASRLTPKPRSRLAISSIPL